MDNKYNIIFFLLFLFRLSLYSEAVEAGVRCIERERQALLLFKKGLEHDHDILASWTGGEDNKECCKWWGVKCSNDTGHVIVLDIHMEDFSLYRYGRSLKGEVSRHSISELQYLRSLDLSCNEFNWSQMGNSIGSLHRLTYLNLSFTNFDGVVPYQLGNITSLQTLDLRETHLTTNNLDWLSQLHFLRYLDLSSVHINTTNWVQVIFNLPFLEELHLFDCGLDSAIPSSTPRLSNASLSILDLSSNNLNSSSIYYWLFNVSKNLVSIDMSYNNLEGLIPDAFGQMIYLQHINLAWNSFEGGVPNSFSNLSHLRSLDLSHNFNLREPFPELLHKLSKGAEKSLEMIDVRTNQFYGSLTGLTRFSSLKKLYLDNNKLEGTLNEIHFSGLSNLKELRLSFNRLALKMSSEWNPAFRLDVIRLANCSMGIHFPKWLRTQHNFSELDLSSASISDTLPDWFLDLSLRLNYLNLSHNEISGRLPAALSQMFQGSSISIDLSSNNFSGPILSIPPNLTALLLYKNRFMGSVFFLCLSTSGLYILDLSDNLFSGNLPNCWMNMENLAMLNLGNNNFSGQIPKSFSFLKVLNTLNLHGNSFIGRFPSYLRDSVNLAFIDIGGNKLSGNIPAWIWTPLTNLEILSLRSNKFSGSIPQDICHLSSMHVLDLSHNDITGKIPQCLSNLTSLVDKNSWGRGVEYGYNDGDEGWMHIKYGYRDGDEGWHTYSVYVSMSLQWKRQESKFKELLVYERIIDLSSNKLDGQIPQEIASLGGLISLNLSGNHLTGTIIERIDKMEMLECLDLSRNFLSGEIPAGIDRLNFLDVLNLSYNNLSGRIPSGSQLQTFDASSYYGNNGLCGFPLEKCPWDGFNPPPRNVQDEDDDSVTKELYISIGMGFVLGLWGIFIIMLKGSWRNAYFVLMQNTHDWIYVRYRVYWARFKRMLSG